MKSIILGLVFLGTFLFLFFLLSIIGLLWVDSYREVIKNGNWFFLYTLFIGSWIPVFPTIEYYDANKEYFNKVFS